MKITRRSILSGKVRTMDLDITEAQYDAWAAGALVQDAFPHLSADDREFLVSGSTSDEWEAFASEMESDELFGD